MIVLGLNSAYHESSAALLIDGQLVAAAEEERFNRSKHGKPASIDNADALPLQAIRYCLKQAGIGPHQLDLVAYSFSLNLRKTSFQADPLATPGGWGTAQGEAAFQASLARVPKALSSALDCDLTGRFSWVPHHLAHAASAYYCCGESSSAILVVDGIAESASTLLAHGQEGAIRVLDELRHPDSLGFLWEKISQLLGFSEYDACKVMGMAAYAGPLAYSAAFGKLIQLREDRFAIDPAVALFRQEAFGPLEQLFGPRRMPHEPITSRHHEIAAALQYITERAVLGLAQHLHARVGGRSLCLAGGVALNCAANGYLAKHGPFEKIYIPPAPHDAGTAVGAALYAVRQKGALQHARHNQTPYLGPDYGNDEILPALQASGVQATPIRDKERLAAQWIAQGHVVAWFQGRMEFGPRALGNRSLLADPRNREIREVMNHKVKHREAYRPFGPSVLEEHAGDWFELDAESESYRYMLFACAAKPGKAPLIPAVIHADDTSRIQLVSASANPAFHRLISHFHALTGVPMVLNTSFNDSEPIVCTPLDALTTFSQTRIDALFIGDFCVTQGLAVPQQHLQESGALHA